jgi:glutathione synthase/RimK-type ligase-like ATP-grasp enzyme
LRAGSDSRADLVVPDSRSDASAPQKPNVFDMKRGFAPGVDSGLEPAHTPVGEVVAPAQASYSRSEVSWDGRRFSGSRASKVPLSSNSMGDILNLLIVSVTGDKSADLLATAGRGKGLRVTELSYETVGDGPIEPRWVPPRTRAILRDPYRKGAWYQATQQRLLDALSPDQVLDALTLRKHPDHEDKLFQFRAMEGHVPVLTSWPATRSYTGPFPVVLKRRIASGGRGTFLVRTPEELYARLQVEAAEECILQEYAELDADYRILILGSRVIATVSRQIRVHEEAEGARLAVKVDAPVTLAPAVVEYARRVAEIFRCDFCGIDIVESRGRHFVIECNVSPQFRSTEKLIGQDIAGDVIDFLVAKDVE